MRYSSLPALEEKFLKNGNNGEYSLHPFSVPVPGEQLTLHGMLCTPANRSGYYQDVEHPKQHILLHYTAGQLVSDLSALTRQDFHVSVAFVLARDGTIYQLFPSKFWSGSIGGGLGNIGTGNARDKQCIAIEISNYGFLTERDGNLETIYSRMKDASGNMGPVDIYCSLTETAAYQKLPAPFRDQSYFATFTSQQYQSLIVLLRYLTAQYNIPRAFLPESTRFTTTNDVLTFKGIVSHVNYRPTGKWDIGPAFDWQQTIEGVQAPTFQPIIDPSPKTGGSMPKSISQTMITSETEMQNIVPPALDKGKENEQYHESEAKTDSHEHQQKKLFALLVGINAYRADLILEGKVKFPQLRGCVEDSQKIKGYLQKDRAFEKHILVLNDQQATKDAIVKAFREHLSNAREGDIALFYFSGHGTQEQADTNIWKTESDGRIECIACYYDEQQQDKFLLADKELRFLIQELSQSKAHIVTIFDCCHSADNTRNGMLVTTAFTETVEKRIPFSFTQRDWKNFIFSDHIQSKQLVEEGEAALLPEGLHVQFSACESDESAVEVAAEGVFTKTLLKVLDATGGDITYYALQNRVRQYLRNVYEQKPRIYIPGGNESMLFSSFLNKPSTGNKTFAEVTYNDSAGWQLNLGGIHGLSEKTKTITIIDPENNDTFTAEVKIIGTDYTFLSTKSKLNTAKVYRGYVENLMSQTLHVHVKNTDGSPADQQALFNALFKSGNNIVFEDTEEQAQYIVHSENGRYYITRPPDAYRPLLQPVSIINEGAVFNLVAYLKQISQWEFLRNLVNQDEQTKIGNEGLQIELFQVNASGSKTPMDISKDAMLQYEQTSKGWKTAILVRLTNRSGKNLYCSTLHLTTFFGSSLKLLNPTVKMLEPGNAVELQFNNNSILESTLNEVAKTYNWKEEIEYLKFIISTEEFNAQQHAMSSLPPPPVPRAPTAMKARGFAEETNSDQQINEGWTTHTIALRLQNPLYNQVSEATLESLLKEPAIADFALGIYFDAQVNENLQPTYQLKPGINVSVDTTGQKSIRETMIDLANLCARRKRNNHYKDVITSFPNRLRIVSEGDSWFEHPLVLDIIDHLSRLYAIYCVAAAGDTLRNYLSDEKSNGEYFLDALDEQNPSFFLISGGGNDILGSQFRSFLADNPTETEPEGENPKRFLKQSIFDELDSLMDIYKKWFGYLEVHKPNLQVIVHGYDYPVKLNDAKKGWLGRYMIEKGINRRNDRKAIIHLIMDTFNKGLSNAAKDFPNVTYIDVRNTVRFNGVDQWYDEIHPNNDGFQQVAMKFIEVIDSIYKEKWGAKSGVLQQATQASLLNHD